MIPEHRLKETIVKDGAEEKWGFKPQDHAELTAAGRKDNAMKNWYLATYKDEDNTYRTCLVLSDSENKAEEHFKDYETASVRIAAEDEIYYYRSNDYAVVEL